MRLSLMAIMLLLLLSITFAQNDVGTEGGNITEVNMSAERLTDLWAGIVGWLNGTTVNITFPVSFQEVPNATIYLNEPNGSYATYLGSPMILTRLPFKPSNADIYTPVPSDFNETGIFSNFTVFSGLNYSLTFEDPQDTFCNPCTYTSCVVNGTAYMCPYIILRQNILMAILKFDNGTHTEPLFFATVQSLQGYNGTYFDFEYMVAAEEDYYFYLYKPNPPPNVTIINPKPITYGSTTVPLVYDIVDDGTIDSCWYDLDGTIYTLPTCGPAYVLSVGEGTHTLTLYANDTLGAVGSDSVNFSVSIKAPFPPGGGPPGSPYIPPEVPPEPPGPPEFLFVVTPEDINVVVDYPKEGRTDFTVSSTLPVYGIECEITGDFAEYAIVLLDSDSIDEENGTISGTIIIDMPPEDILDYLGSRLGELQCTAIENSTEVMSRIANVNLILNKPVIEMENVTVRVDPGENRTAVLPITNRGDGNTTAVNISTEFMVYDFIFEVSEVPRVLGAGEQGDIRFTVRAPAEMEPGVYRIPVDIYENGRLVGTGYFTLSVGVPVGPPELVCYIPDVEWTLLILIIGLITSIWIYKIKSEKEVEIVRKREESRFDKFRRPLAYAALTMAGFFIVWILTLVSLVKCEYLEPGESACAPTDPAISLIILLLGVVLSSAVFKIKLDKESRLKRAAKSAEWEKYKMPLAYALGVFVVFFVIWLIVLLVTTSCA